LSPDGYLDAIIGEMADLVDLIAAFASTPVGGFLDATNRLPAEAEAALKDGRAQAAAANGAALRAIAAAAAGDAYMALAWYGEALRMVREAGIAMQRAMVRERDAAAAAVRRAAATKAAKKSADTAKAALGPRYDRILRAALVHRGKTGSLTNAAIARCMVTLGENEGLTEEYLRTLLGKLLPRK
jgi:hypothetical protein